MRLFIAVNFNDETKDALLRLRGQLSRMAVRGNFTLRENLHLTLAFLGECNEKQATSACAALDQVIFSPFEISIERIGRFGGSGGGSGGESLWWAGIHVGGQLSTLHHALTRYLEGAGFVADKRKFSPHITLGRRIVTDAVPWNIRPFGETIRKIDLMRSERIDGKLTYTAIHSKGCGGLNGAANN